MFKFQAKVIKIDLPVGYGKEGKKKQLVHLSYEAGNKTRMVAVTCFGKGMEALSSVNVGDIVDATILVESREYNDKYYTDATMWEISVVKAARGGKQDVSAGLSQDDDLPF